LLILGRRHLQHVLATYVAHYNEHRPHRALGQRPPLLCALPPDGQPPANVIELDRVGAGNSGFPASRRLVGASAGSVDDPLASIADHPPGSFRYELPASVAWS
jgi:hypothetical protein